MTIERLPSGSYRIKQMCEGKMYSKTIDHKPTQKEAAQIIAMLLSDTSSEKGSFKEATLKYIELKKNVLSPKTIREYRLTLGRLPEWFIKMPLNNITQEHIQRCVNELSVRLSPSSVRVNHAIISAVLGLYRPQLMIRTTLPKKIKKEPYIPSIEDIRIVFKEAENTPFEVPVKLGCYGLRRSEICALTIDDLTDDDVIIINKALVLNSDNEYVIKTTKTEESTRYVPIDHVLANLIRNQGYIYNGFPGTISQFIYRIIKKHGLPRFSLHKMRHFFASQLMDMGVSQKDIMALGGWKTDNVMKTIYQHSIKAKTEEGRRNISDAFSKRLYE